jgi:hypothetical protein
LTCDINSSFNNLLRFRQAETDPHHSKKYRPDTISTGHACLTIGKDFRFLDQGAAIRGGGKRRGNDNIVYVRNLWPLDFENGELHPDEFPKLFPNVRMVAMNTFRHTAEHPRFRIVIPTIQPISTDGYLILYDAIAAKLEDTGYGVDRRRRNTKIWSYDKPKSGLDWSKRHPTSLFYLPSQAEDPSQSFFMYYNDDGREPLDPVLWIENSVAPLQPELPTWIEPNEEEKEVDQTLVESAIQDWRSDTSRSRQ